MAAIYNEGIADRVATFETEPRTAAQMAARLDGAFPAVVVEMDGLVVGFASVSSYRPRDCYAGVGEFSVYVARAARGTGIGRVALTGLIAEAEHRGYWKLLSRIFPENTASRQLCAALGFREVGTYIRHGRLDGEWRDVVIVERLLGEATR
jgi:phosphinothricin acetyltransferase